MDLGTERLIGRKDGAIGWMIFNNPERRNAVSIDMWQAIPGVLEAFEADPEIRVVVFTGAGDKAFVSGADISQFEDVRANREANEVYSTRSASANRAMVRLSKPSIAMIKGFCIGGGMAVALTCDLRVCSDDSRFAIPAATPRPGLWLRWPQGAGRRGRTVVRQGDPVHRAPASAPRRRCASAWSTRWFPPPSWRRPSATMPP